MGIDPTFICARVAPKFTGYLDRVDTGPLPPCSLVACAMNGAVVDATERHREFIAGLTSERPWLHVSKMMWVRRLAATDKAGLLGDEPKVCFTAKAAWFGNCEDALVDPTGLTTFDTGRLRLVLRRHLHGRGIFAR